MTGGIPAIEGFDTQATLTLELMLDYFEKYPETARLRPEGEDDLDVSWKEPDGSYRLRHYQFKKPSRLASGKAVSPWSVADVARELLGAAVRKLIGNTAEQVWILGDGATEEVCQLLQAGRDAPVVARASYLNALHRLAKHQTDVSKGSVLQKKLDAWIPPKPEPGATLEADLSALLDTFSSRATDVEPWKLEAYRARAWELHTHLPEVLSRIQLFRLHGTEKEIAARVNARLESLYHLPRVVVERTLFRNLRGFINDVSKDPHHILDKAEFENELTSVWPQMVATCLPPPLEAGHVRRSALTERFFLPAPILEVVGPSGAGKTLLASEAFEFLEREHPGNVVLYAEVRADTSMQDVLKGVAFSLRRRGIPDLVGPALHMESSHEATVRSVASACKGLPHTVILLIDVIEGDANTAFRRELAAFARGLKGTSLRLVVLSQASILSELSEWELATMGSATLSLPGLHFDEFQEMASWHHPRTDPEALQTIYTRVTAGREAGLLPSVADALVRAGSLDEMRALASQPSMSMLREAHRARFWTLPEPLQEAAQRAICFSLPMTIKEAEDLFPEELMRLALEALWRNGLLRRDDGDRVEMHETIRTGLKDFVPPARKQQTHERLAAFYARLEIPTAQIHHLEEAGRSTDARRIARERFLAGKDRDALARYIGEHRLVSESELIDLLLAEDTDDRHLLPELLAQVKETFSGRKLFETLQAGPALFDRDPTWAGTISEALLRCEPGLLTRLVELGLASPGKREQSQRLERILRAAYKAGIAADESFLAWFERAPDWQKRHLVPFLLLCPAVTRLKKAFGFLSGAGVALVSGPAFTEGVRLVLRSEAEVDAFLQALPTEDPSRMVSRHSVLFGPFAAYIWKEREMLARRCRELLAKREADEALLINAMRTLVYLVDESVLDLSRPLRAVEGTVGSTAWFVPILLGARDRVDEFETIALDSETDLETCLTALHVAAALGSNLDVLHRKMLERRPAEKRGMNFFFLLFITMFPSPALLPLLSEALDREEPRHLEMIAPKMFVIAGLEGPEVTDLLLKALTRPSANLQFFALAALERRRAARAFQPIIELARRMEYGPVIDMAVMAALASGPTSMAPFRDIWERRPEFIHMRWVLAGRLREVGEGPALIAAACDAKAHWRVRRLAILAAGRLPHEAALGSIAPVILSEHSSLPDTDISLRGHMLLAGILEQTKGEIGPMSQRGREVFIQQLAPLYDHWRKSAASVPSATSALGWLWDRLEAFGLQTPAEAVDHVRNELHLPMLHAAVIRGLRLQGRWRELENLVRRAPNDWLRLRAFRECCVGNVSHDVDDGTLDALVLEAPAICHMAMGAFRSAAHTHSQRQQPPPPEPSLLPPVRRMGFVEARELLAKMTVIDDTPIVLSLSEPEFRALLVELDPRSDAEWRPTPPTNPARLSLSAQSWSIADTGKRALRPNITQRRALRPALVAANRFGIDVTWHQEQLRHAQYARQFMASLGAQCDRDRFFEVLARDEELLVPQLANPRAIEAIRHLIDSRALRVLSRYIHAGTEHFFEHLCTLICQVDAGDVEPVLADLFQRWLLLIRARTEQADGSTLWRIFQRITSHPRFVRIPQWVDRLIELLLKPLPWHFRDDIAKLIERSPAAYCQFESLVLSSEQFEHYFDDNTDVYDNIADRLFRTLIER